MAFDRINSPHQIFIEISPNEADLAITSINSDGQVGQLNEYVLVEYGYSIKDLPTAEQLRYAGFGAIPDLKGKPVLFVVTVDGVRDTAVALEDNLFNTLTEFRGWFRNKKVWLPLMGTGAGGLTLTQSYEATARAINRFQKQFPTEVIFIISLPATEDGKHLRNALMHQSPATSESINEFFGRLKCNFFLVGAFWEGDNQLERFFEESIWEKGHEDETYADIINSVEVNDILIVKSTFQQSGISYLRIKALGVVIGRSEDGASLNVDWRIRDISIDVEYLGFYRHTITKADLGDVKKIFSYLDQSLWQRLLPPSTTKTGNPNSIAGLLSDSDKGIDYLDISKDVTAFARVIAARSFEPPLAIALFGKWGSGKSFFMRELKEQIQRISTSGLDEVYCSGIAHIHFNAWSYIDANLWASIVTRIFEGLQQYISKDDKAKNFKDSIEAELTKQLNITQEEVQKLETQKNSLDKQIAKLNEEKTKIESKLNAKIKQIESNTLSKVITTINERFNVRAKIEESLNSNESFIATSEELNRLIPERYWESPEQLYKKSKSAITFIKDFFTGRSWWINVLWLIGILVLVFAMPEIIQGLSHWIGITDFTLPPRLWYTLSIAAPFLIRGIDTYRRLQPSIAAFWKIKLDYETQRNLAISEYEQKEKALKLEIEKKVSDIASINQQVKQATGLKASLQFKIEHALSTQALYSFIEKRCNSEDYQKHLGIVSVIRKDFEILSALFNDHRTELVSSEDKLKFRSLFDRPLERIVLYIDDLDRCPEDVVVQVIDSVNLLMAYPLFIVIVGVDPHWIKNALIKKHTFQFTGEFIGFDKPNEQIEKIDPAFYLEKIFQVPFHLKDAPKQKVREMIKSLADSKPKVSISRIKNDDLPADTRQSSGNEAAEPNLQDPIGSTASPNNNTPSNVTKERPEAIEISQTEIALLQDVGEIIGENPRAIKRFINTYRIIKAHEDFSYDARLEKNELLVIMFLLALPISNYRKLMKSFEMFIGEPLNAAKPLQSFLGTSHDLRELNGLKHDLDLLLSDKESYQILQNEPAINYSDHNEFIKRFTFKNI